MLTERAGDPLRPDVLDGKCGVGATERAELPSWRMMVFLGQLLDLVGFQDGKLGCQFDLSRAEALASLSKTSAMRNAKEKERLAHYCVRLLREDVLRLNADHD